METEHENESLKTLLTDNSYEAYSFWIGLSDLQKEGTNVWEETGALPTYEDYYTDYVEEEDLDCKRLFSYIIDDKRQFRWNNDNCMYYNYQICEYPAYSQGGK